MEVRSDELELAGGHPVKRGPAGRVRAEVGPMLRLAVPVVVAELGWMAMGIVDTVTVGPLGAEATGAVGLGSNLFIAAVIFGLGLLLGLDTLVAQEHGAGQDDEARRSLAQGVYLALLSTPIFMGLIRLMAAALPSWGLLDAVLVRTVPYLDALAWSTAPLLVFAGFRRYLQAVDVVRPITFALVTANVVNALACWALVYGRLGAPRLGVEGAGWATFLARVYLMVVVLISFGIWGWRPASVAEPERLARPETLPGADDPWRPPVVGDRGRGVSPFRHWPGLEPSRLARLLRLGWPAALQVTLEVGVFATATALAGKLDATSLAAHQIVLNVSSLTFMVPLGVASAGAVRVGQALGRGDSRAAATSGWAALLIGAAFMTASGLTLLALARPIAGLFTTDPAVIAMTTGLFLLAAAFQLFDGIQVVATGVLRGAGDTRGPMLCNLVAHWLVGLPLGSVLAFGLGRGIVGLWVGLSIGLTVAGMANLATWARRARRLDRSPGAPGAALVALGPPGVS